MRSSHLRLDSADAIVEDQLYSAFNQIRYRSKSRRQQPNIRILAPPEKEDNDGPEQFKANPCDDIPRNKLTECLARGLQAYVQIMQKRESFYAEIVPIKVKNWTPAPRENSTLCQVNDNCYLVGGQNHECNNEIARLLTSKYAP